MIYSSISYGFFKSVKTWIWTNYTSDTYWQCNVNCVPWNGSVWTEAGPGMSLVPVGSWAVDFRPTKLRVTHSALPDAFTVGVTYDDSGGDGEADYVSGTEINLNVTADIIRINLHITDTVSAIEFLV